MRDIVTAFFLSLLAAEVSGKCKTEEVEFCSSARYKQCFCRKCILCLAGYGPSYSCGELYTNVAANMACESCVEGKSYSDNYGISSCQPCALCGNKKTLRKCTVKNNTVCSNECKYGYKMDPITDLCLPDHSLVITTNKLPFSTPKPKGKTFDASTPTQAIHTQSKELETTKNQDTNQILLIIIVGVIGLIIIGIIICFYKKIHRICAARQQGNARQQEEKIALTCNDSPKTSKYREEVHKQLWPADLKLIHIPNDLKRKIAISISEQSSLVKGWKDIGELMKFSTHDLKAIKNDGQKDGTNEGEQVLIKLSSTEPNMTLSEFVSHLVEMERNDVVEIIKEHYRKTNVAVQLD